MSRIYILPQGEEPTQQGPSLWEGKLKPPSFLPHLLSTSTQTQSTPQMTVFTFSKAGPSSALFLLLLGLGTSSPILLPQGWLVILPKGSLSFLLDQKPLFLILNPRCLLVWLLGPLTVWSPPTYP